MSRADVVNVVAGSVFLAFAGLSAAYVFTIHERLYAYGIVYIGALATAWLALLGTAYSLIFGLTGRRVRL